MGVVIITGLSAPDPAEVEKEDLSDRARSDEKYETGVHAGRTDATTRHALHSCICLYHQYKR